MEKKKHGFVKKTRRKIVKSFAGRGNCQAGKINLTTERNIKIRKPQKRRSHD